MYCDRAIASATNSLPVPDGPVISVVTSPMDLYRERKYRRILCVKTDRQTSPRSSTAGIDAPKILW